jgi:hypothetical protein
MSEDFWEQVVENYLTLDRGVFVNPQYMIGDCKWDAHPDLVAINFRDSEIWMIEVTIGDARGLIEKAVQFDREYIPRLQAQFLEHQIITDESAWKTWRIGMWAFVKMSEKVKVEKRLLNSVRDGRVTALEDIAFPWVYWNARFR